MRSPAGAGAGAAEWRLTLAATGLAAIFHLLMRLSAGALWRDEVVSIRNAALPSVRDIWDHLQCDSFPLVWPLLLRAWSQAGAEADAAWLRSLGLLIGLALLAALWLNARFLGHDVPTMAIALLGLNTAVVAYGDSVRGYGLGMLTALMAFGLTWRLAETPGPWRAAAALAAMLAAVHTTFHNAVVVLAACAGGAAVCLRRARPGALFLVAGLGAVTALSLLPYTLTLASTRDWVMTVRYDVDLAWIWSKFRQANASTGPWARWVWIVASLAAAVVAARMQAEPLASRVGARARDVALYCGTALLIGVPAYILFLRLLRYRMNPWYFLALLALMAACIDGILGALREHPAARRWRVGCLALLAAVAIVPLARELSKRRTNIDLVAARIAREADPGDVVVANPWIYGHTLQWYYHGPAPWTTLPEIEIPHLPGDVGLLKLTRQMREPRAVEPVLRRMALALEAGHRVWWVGHLTLPGPSETDPDVVPAPDGPFAWNEALWHRHWSLQAGAFVRDHVLRVRPVPLDGAPRVSRYEDVELTILEGWKSPAAAF